MIFGGPFQLSIFWDSLTLAASPFPGSHLWLRSEAGNSQVLGLVWALHGCEVLLTSVGSTGALGEVSVTSRGVG